MIVGEGATRRARNAVEYRPAQPDPRKGEERPRAAPGSRCGRPRRPASARWHRCRWSVVTGARGPDRALGARDRRRASAASSRSVRSRPGSASRALGLELAQLVADQGARGDPRPLARHAARALPTALRATRSSRSATIFDSDEPDDARDKAHSRRCDPRRGSCSGRACAAARGAARSRRRECGCRPRARSLFSARVFVESLALNYPTMLLFEDIHWADPSHARPARDARIPACVTCPCSSSHSARPELLTDRPTLGRRAPAVHGPSTRSRLNDSSRARSSPSICSPTHASRGCSQSGPNGGGNPLHRGAGRVLAERSTADASSRPAFAPSSRRAWTHCHRTSGASRSTRFRRRARRSGVARCAEMSARDDMTTVLGSLEAEEPRPTRGGLAHQGRPAVRVQARPHPRGCVQDAPRAARRARHAAVARFLEATTAVGSHTRRSGTTGVEAGEPGRAVEHLDRRRRSGRPRLGQAARCRPLPGGARSHVRGRCASPRRDRADSRSPSRRSTTSPTPNVPVRRTLTRVVDQREVVGRDVARDLVDRLRRRDPRVASRARA